jgi:2-polyprenyl-3-methyl-5-hydroxy-6-metoxy-1,4-benzoquinol methylase
MDDQEISTDDKKEERGTRDAAQRHWEQVYTQKPAEDVSWFQARPELSIRLIAAAGADPESAILDVGGGASRLVDCLLELGYRDLSVLDIADAALREGRRRLGDRGEEVHWLHHDVLSFRPDRRYMLWHDRALFHFMTEAAQRKAYVATLEQTLQPDGQAIIATFAKDGPLKCSGLNIVQYDAEGLMAELGQGWRLEEQVCETHVTPWNAQQSFQYFRLRRESGANESP